MHRVKPKTGFLAISSKISILGDMLLHKSYINVAIANILNGQINFYDSLGPNHRKSSKFVHRMKPKPFFGCIFDNKHFRGYVASQV